VSSFPTKLGDLFDAVKDFHRRSGRTASGPNFIFVPDEMADEVAGWEQGGKLGDTLLGMEVVRHAPSFALAYVPTWLVPDPRVWGYSGENDSHLRIAQKAYALWYYYGSPPPEHCVIVGPEF
jgi:hypothetical protein